MRCGVHYYRVTAVDKSGNESDKSGPATIIPKDTEPPGDIAGLTAEVDGEKRYVTLSWQPLNEDDLAGYFIYRGESKEKMMRIVKDPVDSGSASFKDKGYRDKGLRPGRELFYSVTGVDTSGNESGRVFVDAVIPDNVPPPPPFSISVKPDNKGVVILTWQPCLSRDLEKHYVYRSGEGEPGFTKTAELDKEVYRWEDTSVEKGKEYRYRITEVDKSGNESKPSREVMIVPTDVTAPAPPAGLKAEVERWGVRLLWEPSPEDDVIGYNIYSHLRGGDNWRLTAELIEENEYFHRRGREGFSYAVTAVDSSGNESRKSPAVTAEVKELDEVQP